MLRTRSIKAEVGPSDGTRISVMSRHTLTDGITPDPEITVNHYDEWWPELAPPSTLVGAYYKRGMNWATFEDIYRNYLKEESVAVKVVELINLAQSGIVTILCIEDSPVLCHRRLLAEECVLLEPSLEIEIR